MALHPLFPVALLAAALFSLLLVARQWEVFCHSFTTYKSLEGILVLGCTIPLAKILHEFGHAFAAQRYGCKVPSMGLALVVLTPMLFTDTNEAWKLASRRQRLVIVSAGMLAELTLAVAAMYAWIVLPDGPWRGAFFVLATTTWIISLTLNASPFMRFDGYFFISDLVNIPNLHSRSFAFGRWWLRERLFAFGDPEPEAVQPGKRAFLVFFALFVWVYRLVVFFGIAVLVYHFFFKTLGILLFCVELGWFIAFPIFGEFKAWWLRRHEMRFNLATLRSLALTALALLLLAVPWRSRISAPAVLSAAHEQQLVAPMAAKVVGEFTKDHALVHKGDLLIELASPDLEHRIASLRKTESIHRWSVEQQTLNAQMLSEGGVTHQRWEGTASELAGLLEEKARLSLRAPFDGELVFRNDEVTPGSWVSAKERLYIIAELKTRTVNAYVEEGELSRIRVDASARFVPGSSEFPPLACQVSQIDRVNVPYLDEPALSSIYGGPIPSQMDRQHEPTPLSPLFRVRLVSCSSAASPPIRLIGTAHINAEERSILVAALRHAYFVILRESGL